MREETHHSRKIREPIRDKNKDVISEKKSSNSIEKNIPDTKNQKKLKEEQLEKSFNEEDKSALSLLNISLILLSILFIILLFVYALSFFDEDSNPNYVINESEKESLLSEKLFNDSASLSIVIVENSNCEFCQIDELEEDLKLLAASEINTSNISVSKISYNSSLGVDIFKEIDDANLSYNFSPLVLISEDLSKLEIFKEEEINSLFTTSDSLDYYLISAQTIQVKYLNSNLNLPNSSISFGNEKAVPITYIFDYECARCQVMNGNEESIELFKKNSRISNNYSAPIKELLEVINTSQNFDELSFKLNIIPAPTSPNSEKLHRAIYCANKQNLFLPMHQNLVQIGSNNISNESLSNMISREDGNKKEFEQCLVFEETDEYIDSTNKFLANNEITSLPVLLVGNYPLLGVTENSIVSLLVESELNNVIMD